MTTFVLVHGAWSSAWDWLEVASNLRAEGHAVHVPTLTGLGERGHVTGADRQIGLDVHVQDIIAFLEWYNLEDVVLVGHSYAGMVITGAASHMPKRIRTLFYLDAFVPADGQSLADLSSPGAQAHLEAVAEANAGHVPPLIRQAEAPSGVRAEDYALRLRPMPLACFTQPARLTGDEAGGSSRIYLYATRGAPTSRTRFFDVLRDEPTWRVLTIDTGHVVMIDDPVALTRLLVEAAGE